MHGNRRIANIAVLKLVVIMFQRPKKKKVASPQSVLVVDSSQIKIFFCEALKRSIPYPVPSHILQACRRQSSFPGVIVPSCSICELCGSSLTTGQQHPGRALNDPSYILTPWSLTQVNVLVKFCSSKDCKAMHQAWPIDQGMCYGILSLCSMFFFPELFIGLQVRVGLFL